MGEDEARVQGCSKFKDLLGAGSSVGSLTWCSPGFLRQSRYGQTSARLRVLSQVWQIYMSLIAISRFLREGIPWSIESLGSNMVCREKTFIYSSMILMLFQDLSNKPPFSSWMGGFPSLPCLIRGFAQQSGNPDSELWASGLRSLEFRCGGVPWHNGTCFFKNHLCGQIMQIYAHSRCSRQGPRIYQRFRMNT